MMRFIGHVNNEPMILDAIKMKKFSEGLLNEAAILENLNLHAGQAILDAGCGNGYMAKKFSKLVGNSGKIYALDIDRGFIYRLNKMAGWLLSI